MLYFIIEKQKSHKNILLLNKIYMFLEKFGNIGLKLQQFSDFYAISKTTSTLLILSIQNRHFNSKATL